MTLAVNNTSAAGKLLRKAIVFILIICLSGFLGWTYVFYYQGNFGAVIPGQIYRSAQLSADHLQKVINQYQIKSVINLRGFKQSDSWYQQEKKATENAGAVLYNATELGVGLQAQRLPARKEIRGIINMIKTLPRPMLVHCQKGADRTGLFSSIAILLQQQGTLEQAWEHSSLKYFAIHTSNGRLFMQAYENWLGRQKHTPQLFIHWINQIYIPHYYLAHISPINPPKIVKTERQTLLTVRVVNKSREIIPLRAANESGAHLGGHFFMRKNHQMLHYRVLTGNDVDVDLEPGKDIVLELPLPKIHEPGNYEVILNLLDEYAWFDAKGSPNATVYFQVKG